MKGKSRNTRQFLPTVPCSATDQKGSGFCISGASGVPQYWLHVVHAQWNKLSWSIHIWQDEAPPGQHTTTYPTCAFLSTLLGRVWVNGKGMSGFHIFLLGFASVLALACISVCLASQQPADSSWLAAAPYSFAIRGYLCYPHQVFLSPSSLHITPYLILHISGGQLQM